MRPSKACKEIRSVDLRALAKAGIEKKQFGHDFVYRYPPSAEMPAMGLERLKRELRASDFSGQRMAFYAHFPFCTSICAYCHYYKKIPAGRTEIESYLRAMEKEITAYGGLVKGSVGLDSVFFGGGTPTMLEPAQLGKVLDKIIGTFGLDAHNSEVSVESSPETLDEKKLFALGDAGFNRLSIGMQDFNDGILERCNRNHSAAQAAAAFDSARSAGFKNINIDLIYGLPGQTIGSWGKNLEKIGGLRPESITASDLRVLQGTGFFAKKKEEFPSVKKMLWMYSSFVEKMLSLGYVQQFPYQFVRSGKEMRFLENQWSNGQFVGFGASSCSFMGGWDYNNWFPLREYQQAVEQGISAALGKKLGKLEMMIRMVSLGLKKSGLNRRKKGVDKKEFLKIFGLEIEEAFPAEIRKLESLGLLENSGHYLALGCKGLFFHDEAGKVFWEKK
ncbi:MAG: coproporphyrinogen-III oxidase family protein [Candidatus Diapherotrites archaeon]|nr:coproporphyrinogen-III oxidase family protein [Candidatus Diapherotrites archaeon]